MLTATGNRSCRGLLSPSLLLAPPPPPHFCLSASFLCFAAFLSAFPLDAGLGIGRLLTARPPSPPPPPPHPSRWLSPELPEWDMEKYRFYLDLPGDFWEGGQLMAYLRERQVGGRALEKVLGWGPWFAFAFLQRQVGGGGALGAGMGGCWVWGGFPFDALEEGRVFGGGLLCKWGGGGFWALITLCSCIDPSPNSPPSHIPFFLPMPP